jgi:hypothetical protein
LLPEVVVKRSGWLALGLALAVSSAGLLGGCTGILETHPPGTVLQDGSVYLGWTWVAEPRGFNALVVHQGLGRFSKLRILVLDGSLSLERMVVRFADGEEWTPTLGREFGNGQYSPYLELPKAPRDITTVTVYGTTRTVPNLRTRAEIYALR